MKIEQKLLIELLKSEFDNTYNPNNLMLNDDILENSIILDHYHSIAPIVADALLKHNLLDNSKLKDAFKDILLISIYQYQKQKVELIRICDILAKNQICHIPLKGAVIRELYPEPYLRTCSDVDILVHPEDLERAIDVLKSIGYGRLNKCVPDVTLYSPNGVHLELHFDLIIEERDFASVRKVLTNIWDYAVPKNDNSYEYILTDEMYYFYHIAHMAKHFRAAGCGIRCFCDLLILNSKIKFDKEKRIELLKQGGVLKFAEYAEKLTNIWFNNDEYDDITKIMELYVFNSSTCGSQKNLITIKLENDTKFRLIISKIFLKYDMIKLMYPILQKYRWLTPIYQFRRWCEIIFINERRKKSKTNVMNVLNVTENDILTTKK